jgi:hypothetical protein
LEAARVSCASGYSSRRRWLPGVVATPADSSTPFDALTFPNIPVPAVATSVFAGIQPCWSGEPSGRYVEPGVPRQVACISPLAAGEETWLIFRTRQLDDNDRLWVAKTERRGNRFIVEMSQATWQGPYWKNFTYYNACGVNLGKRPPGEYEAKWIVRPLLFRQFADAPDLKPDLTNRWPKDERPAEAKPVEFLVKFKVVSP